ncbi:MAG: hypothetical protein NVSMB65_14940 [Chloroflexota bacterium]
MSPSIPVVSALADLPLLGTAVVAIGTFYGVHRGHRYLLTQACQRAHTHGDAFVIITFTPNPQAVLRPGLRQFQLSAAPVKLDLLRGLGPDCIALLPFTREMAATSADDFMSTLEARLTLREMWMGEDFAFGHKRSGNVAYLIARGQTSGFSVHVIPPEGWRGRPVSSTRIRQALAEGDIALANDLLGHPLRLLGTLGGDTLWLPVEQALPAPGAYAVTVERRSSPTTDEHARSRSGVLSVPDDPRDTDGLCPLPLALEGAATELRGAEVEVSVLERRVAREARRGGDG